ncbi:MAG: putative transposase [Ancylomarina sp.]|jgi:putative transposase
MLSDGLSKIIRWYKGRVSYESMKVHADFTWQARFHDHIIRNDELFQKIRDYINNNSLTWAEDKFYIMD